MLKDDPPHSVQEGSVGRRPAIRSLLGVMVSPTGPNRQRKPATVKKLGSWKALRCLDGYPRTEWLEQDPGLEQEVEMDRNASRPVSILLLVVLLGFPSHSSGFTSGNLLVATRGGTSSFVPQLIEITPQGVQVQAIEIPIPGDDSARDLVVDEGGQIHVFNGTFDPF